MTLSPEEWSELTLVEEPLLDVLRSLGYAAATGEELAGERDSLREAILPRRLGRSLKRLNPWLSDEQVHRAMREISQVQAASLLDANEAVHTKIAFGITLAHDAGAGRKGHTVRFLDFDDPSNNEWLAVRQLRVQGSRVPVIPDIVLYANGLPLVVIECKSPTLGERWLDDAVDQLLRYQEAREADRDRGAPRLFHTVQVCVATCAQAAFAGTVGTPRRFYSAWKVPYPETADDVARRLGKDAANSQEILAPGLLAPATLLEVVRHYVTFERDPTSRKVVKKIPRYQQFAAVEKAVARAGGAGTPAERGGVVWHTQGSGKSLSMLWLATKLRRDPAHAKPTLVVVTDRRDLDDQITGTFQNAGFPDPVRAKSVRHLRELLRGPSGATVLTTVQKFQELAEDRAGADPVLSAAGNLFVLTDEAHRTQYGSLAANLRRALPNTVFFGFTGTPIDKRDRSTLHTFGSYIDTYTIQQAVDDNATVPILYEGRLPELRLAGAALDRVFTRLFGNLPDEEKRAIRRRYATEQAIAEAPQRIRAVCLDLLEHFETVIRPNGFKGQVVTVSRRAAVLYKEMLDELGGPPSAVVLSSTNDDDALLARHATTPGERKTLRDRFLDPKDELSLLVVCDMLLTGFDAPVEQVMYLDAPLREHTLLQAIARVNRTAEQKTYGLVVDYWGVSDELQEALAIFAPGDVQGAMTPKADELPLLQARWAAALRFFGRVRDRGDLEACIRVVEPEDVRAEFEAAFRRFAESMDRLLPDPKALDYAADLRWLGRIRQSARARYRDRSPDLADCGAKVRKLIEEAIVAEGVRVLVTTVHLLSPDFDAKLAALQGDDAKASEMEHALRAEIHVRLSEDPAWSESLAQRLERLVAERRERRIDAARQLEGFHSLRSEIAGRPRAAEAAGLSGTGLALYGLLGASAAALRGEEVGEETPYGEPDGPRRDLAARIEAEAAEQTRTVDWTEKESVQREIRRRTKHLLKEAGYPPDQVERLAAAVLDVLRGRAGR